jgi:hypothetical protein
MQQPQREALFDLLTLSIYCDHHISLTEETLLESAFIAEGWESEYPKNLFLEKSFARAREAADADDTMASYLAKRAAVFDDEESQTEVYGVIRNVLTRDGLVADDVKFLELLKAALPKVS